ncbi:MAG: magnesium and cobalt transport protein CorA, partial [Planctomycetota bacterium]
MARLFATPRRRQRRMPGAPPGTITIDPDAPPPKLHVIAYGPDAYVEHDVEDLADLPSILEAWPVVWINVDGLGDERVLRRLQEMFSLHRLAMEDVSNVMQRPKVEAYNGQLFAVTRMAYLPGHLESEQLSAFLGANWVLTFQVRPGDCLAPVRDRIRKGLGRIRVGGADYLAYALLDAVVDNYFPLLEEYGERLQTLEDHVIAHPVPEAVGDIHQVKRDLLHLRRALWPQREMVGSLLRDEYPQIKPETQVYLRDVYDHIAQLMDMLETYR